MATITLSDKAPDTKDALRFSFGNGSLEVKPGGSVESTDAEVLASAEAHPWLKVEAEAVESDSAEDVAKAVADSKNPHVNRTADHLSGYASDEVLKAAEDAEAATRADFDGVVVANEPVVETVKAAPVTVATLSTSTQSSGGSL